MSTVLTKAPSGAKSKNATLLLGPPQVNLLPPEVRAARGLRSTKRILVLALVGVVGVCGVGFAVSTVTAAAAVTRLADAQAETTRLMLEQAEYAEVPRVKSALSETHRAIRLGMSTEIQWKSYLDAITAVLPEGVSVDVLTTTGATPMTGNPAGANPLQPASTGQITFTVRSLTVPNTASWIEALDSVPGLAGAWTSAVTITADEAGTTYYDVSASVQVLDTAYSHRFEPVEGEN